MWGYLGRQPWPPPEQLEDELFLFVKGLVVVMCRNIGLYYIEIYGSYLNTKEMIRVKRSDLYPLDYYLGVK
jgi:hypothetical protein